MSYDELGLDTLGDERTALFFMISDTDTTYNFIIPSQLAGEGDHLHADGQPHKGPVGKLRAQHPEAGPGAP